MKLGLVVAAVVAVLECGVVPVCAQDEPSLKFGRNLQIDFRVKMQVDVREGELDINRKRVGIEGRFLKHFEYQIERELDSDRPWRDVFVDAQLFESARVRGGHFKLPFGLDQLTSPTRLDFVYRSRVGQDLTPGRDTGLSLHGRLMGRRLGYELGAFSRDGDNARWGERRENPGAGATVAARFTVRPYRAASTSALRKLELGVNATAGDIAEGRHSLRSRTIGGEELFEPVYVSGRRLRVGADASWRSQGFSAAVEGLRVRDERRGQGVLGDDLQPVLSSGWYASGSWLMTGETKTDRIDPRRPLFQGGIGALELAARVERIGMASGASDEAPARHPRAVRLLESSNQLMTLGVNWYLNRWMKVQANAICEKRGHSSDAAWSGRSVVWTPVFRVQVVL